MMKILNFGSLNIDNVCQVPHFVRPGETLAANSFERFAGGKGLNQSLALARSGVTVCHAGRIGGDGIFLKEILEASGVDCRFLRVVPDELSGCAMIQVSDDGENCIVLYGGANQNISPEDIEEAFAAFDAGDILLIQNEINHLELIIAAAVKRQMRIFFNPAPMRENVLKLDLSAADTFIVNEIEGADLAGVAVESDYRTVIAALQKKYPQTNILMTLGAQGAVYAGAGEKETIYSPACEVEKVVDTTAAGDTFIGYFLSGIVNGQTIAEALKTASKASAHCISIKGAANSIPYRNEL
jgi:ribokinase